VADEQQGEAQLGPQLAEQVEDGGLHRHVKGRGDLVTPVTVDAATAVKLG
jgi:hypothetical protein